MGRIKPQRKTRKVDSDYAMREYGATPEQVSALANAAEEEYRRLKRSGKLVTVNTEQLRSLYE